MEIIDKKLTLSEFETYIKDYNFGTKPADKLVIHHTWRPTSDSWAGERTIQGLKNYYEGKGWSAGPHLFIAEDGIWLFSPMRENGIHAGQLNDRSVGIEVVGDYDNQKWPERTKYYTLGAIKALMARLNITNQNIFFHRDVSAKSCPGWAITKEWLFAELDAFRKKPLTPTVDQPLDEISAPVWGLPVPTWAQEAVNFVVKNGLFEIQTQDDIRDAVKFYRFYQLIDKEYE
jgi:hypothetical protein